MTVRRTAHRVSVVVIAMVVWSAVHSGSVSAQDTLARAKDLYLSASYDEALTVLDGLKGSPPHDTATEIAQYRVLCLLALNRSDDAKEAIENMVKLDPFYRPSDTQMSPRVRTVIEDTRKALLPALVQRLYAEAKAAFDRKDPQATKLFERVLLLLDDPDMPGSASMADLRTVASGFRDLSKAVASAAAAPPPPLPTATIATPVVVAQEPTTSSLTPPAPRDRPAAASPQAQAEGAPAEKVVPPITLSQVLPIWAPGNSPDAKRAFKGSIEISIDERGTVTNAMVRESTNPVYDAALLEAARGWKYKPATRNGVAVPSSKVIGIELQPTVR